MRRSDLVAREELRAHDEELGQRIAEALSMREVPGTLLLGKYRVDGCTAIDDRVERFDATRVTDGRWVSIEMLAEDAAADPRMAHAFKRSARAQCRLRHRHVLAALDWGMAADGRPFLVREAIDTEPLRALIDLEGTVPWPRARSIALQIGSAVTAAREQGLAPVDLSIDGCVRARHDGSADDVRVGALVELDALEPGQRDERSDVLAIARILEHLVMGLGQRGLAQVGIEGFVVPAPPRELGRLLARATSAEPSRRPASVVQLGLAISGIAANAPTAVPRAVAQSRSARPQRVARPLPAPVPVERALEEIEAIAIDDVDVIEITASPEITTKVAAPAEIVCVTAAQIVHSTAPVVPLRSSRPRSAARWWMLPGLVLGLGLGAGAVHVVQPAFWPNVAAQARDGVDTIRHALRHEPTGVAAASPVPVEEPLAPPPIPASVPVPEPPRVTAPLPPLPPSLPPSPLPETSPATMPRSVGVPPPPPILPPVVTRPRPKRVAPVATPIATTGIDVVVARSAALTVPREEEAMHEASNAMPDPDGPTPSRPTPGAPPPDTKPEIGPMGEPPGIPSPLPDPKHHDELPDALE